MIAPAKTYPSSTADAERQVVNQLRHLADIPKDSTEFREGREHISLCASKWNTAVRGLVRSFIQDEDAKEEDRLDFVGAAQLIEIITEHDAELLFRWGLLQQHDAPRPISRIVAQILKDQIKHDDPKHLDEWTAWWRGLLDVEPWPKKDLPGLEI